MTPLNTIIEEEKKEFKKRFTTYGHGYHLNDRIPPEEAYDFLTTAMQRAYKAGKADWLRSEIEKLEGVAMKNTKDESTSDWFYGYGWNHALTSIITRHKEELEVLESK